MNFVRHKGIYVQCPVPADVRGSHAYDTGIQEINGRGFQRYMSRDEAASLLLGNWFSILDVDQSMLFRDVFDSGWGEYLDLGWIVRKLTRAGHDYILYEQEHPQLVWQGPENRYVNLSWNEPCTGVNPLQLPASDSGWELWIRQMPPQTIHRWFGRTAAQLTRDALECG